MKPARVVIGIAAIGIVAAVFGNSNGGYKDLGSGLVMLEDGTVVAVWDLPGCESQDDAFQVADVAMPNAGRPGAIWRARFDRGW